MSESFDVNNYVIVMARVT